MELREELFNKNLPFYLNVAYFQVSHDVLFFSKQLLYIKIPLVPYSMKENDWLIFDYLPPLIMHTIYYVLEGYNRKGNIR